MLLKYFYDATLAHASYLVGCQRSGEALVIDPGRSVDQYLNAAKAEGLRIVGSAETHIHADFVSGSLELADRVGAKLFLSDEGPVDWKYQFATQYESKMLKNRDVFYVGKIKIEVLHTPGHTPESISFIVTDEGGGAKVPMGIFTGDFVFVGSIGRPDLLETAAGVKGSADVGARQLYSSILSFRELPDYMQVWPAHGAGSACGKGLGAIPSSTVGYEKVTNPALQFYNEQAFVDYILSDQPETPFYFANMKRVNKVGPELIRTMTLVKGMNPSSIKETAKNSLVIDTRASVMFAESHVPGTINIPSASLAKWVGYFVDHKQPVFLITEQSALASKLSSLRSIGIDKVHGYFDTEILHGTGLMSEAYRSATPECLREQIEQHKVNLFDVRSLTEFEAGHIASAQHVFLGRLMRVIAELDRSKPAVLQCQGGGRSAIASSLMQRAGFDVINMTGGYQAWAKAGFPIKSKSAMANV